MPIPAAKNPPVQTKSRTQALDGIRGVAIGAVIASHYVPVFAPGGFDGGAYGVLVFFVLSGYLITTLLLKEHERTGRIELKAFYIRRALRLLPALYLFLLVALALAFTVGRQLRMDPDGAVTGAVMAFFYVFNFADFQGLQIPHSMTVLWTLSVEEQFYLLWPLVLILLLGAPALKPRLQKLVLGAAVVFTLLGIVAFLFLGLMSFYRTWTWIAPLLLGASLAIAQRRTQGQFGAEVAKFAPIAWCLLLLVALSPPTLNSVVTHAVVVPLLSLASCVIIARSTGSQATVSTRVLGSPLLVYVGRRSYGLYLWNLLALESLEPFITDPVLLIVCALAVAFAVAEASYRWVEMPALRHKHRFERAQLA
ncbi:acyltransferase family protein [Specibacter sp. NPDC057265]|uniref:acyltransferase family protein n=1 Tax=Specibacter sp. NPDC057265 TaxID=3346075 RepID=UPI00362F72A5